MAQSAAPIIEEKNKSDWQLFTNDGKFDSKLPPSQRLHQTKGIFCADMRFNSFPLD